MESEVTVITAAYNASAYLEKCIQSVLEQTVYCQMILINDASTDETVEIAEKYKKLYPQQIRVLSNEHNCGVAVSRNKGIRQADTEYVAILDADDWWTADKIERQLCRIKEKKADACYSGREIVTSNGICTGHVIHVPETIDYKNLLRGNVIPCSSVIMKKSVALQYPMEHDELHEDYITWLSMLRDGRTMTGIDEPFLKSRMAEHGKSRNKIKSAIMTYKVYRYMGIPVWKSVYYFLCYAVAGVNKYKGAGKQK